MSDDWLQQLIRDYQDTITRGAYEGIYQLDENSLDKVMHRQAHACAGDFVKLYDLPPKLDLDTFLARIANGGPSKIDIRRDGDTIRWEEQHEGQCMCPLVRRQVIDLKPALCVCAVHWLRLLIERHTQQPVHVEMLDSVARGNRNCVFRITLQRPGVEAVPNT